LFALHCLPQKLSLHLRNASDTHSFADSFQGPFEFWQPTIGDGQNQPAMKALLLSLKSADLQIRIETLEDIMMMVLEELVPFFLWFTF
jgi:hypothetical protein